jgi:hypothetical protein
MSASSWFSKMTGTAMRLENLENLLTLQLQDLYSAEDQLIKALPKMAEAASSAELKSAFETHLEETRHHKQRLEEAFRMMGQEPKMETCEAMKGLITEGSEVIDLEGEPDGARCEGRCANCGSPAGRALRNRRLRMCPDVRTTAWSAECRAVASGDS